MSRLQKNQTVKLLSGEDVLVNDILGEGGQGVVYKVTYNGKAYALKWYSKVAAGKSDDLFYRNLCCNVKKGSPASTFLWPIAVTEKDDKGCFGYIMELRPTQYKDFSQYLLNRFQYKSFTSILNTALLMAASFRMLHNQGYSYQDLNDGNFFVNPEDGDLLICDNDNVSEYGTNLGIQGKPRYMAPEVVVLNHKPDTWSDRFSLSVVLFLLMFRAHPLMGRADNPKIDPAKNELNLYCKNPVFIFDENDESNRPDSQIHRNALLFWSVYPNTIKKEFIKAFNKALMNADGSNRDERISEKEWLKELVILRHKIIVCPKCNEETFYKDEEELCTCVNCNKTFSKPPFLVIGKHRIPLQPDRRLFNFDIDDDDVTVDSMKIKLAEVIANKNNPTIWGLKNISQTNWVKTTPSGKIDEIGDGGVVPIARGVKIKIKDFEGYIE